MMKMRKLFLIAAVVTLIYACEKKQAKTVVIGNQEWMTENLNVVTFRNGDPIPQAATDEEWKNASANKQPAWCYYNNDSANGEKYGKLYNWYAVNDPRGMAPEGWRVPKNSEWNELTAILGGITQAGRKMKSSDGWKENGNGKNNSGFSALPGGSRSSSGNFEELGNITLAGYNGYWWSSTIDNENTSKAWFCGLYYTDDGVVVSSGIDKGEGLSVRCLKN